MSIDDEGRAPICPYCGVTALPGDAGHVLDPCFICENPDCEAFGEAIEAGWIVPTLPHTAGSVCQCVVFTKLRIAPMAATQARKQSRSRCRVFWIVWCCA